MSVPDTVRHGAKEVIFESYPELGYNYRMTDIQAAVGREQLKRLPEIIQRRRFLAKKYRELLITQKEMRLPEEPFWARSNWQSYCVRLPPQCAQRQVMQFMLDQNIATRRGIMCAHQESAYANHESWFCGSPSLAESEIAQNQSIILPLYPQMQDFEQDRVVETLLNVCKVTD